MKREHALVGGLVVFLLVVFASFLYFGSDGNIAGQAVVTGNPWDNECDYVGQQQSCNTCGTQYCENSDPTTYWIDDGLTDFCTTSNIGTSCSGIGQPGTCRVRDPCIFLIGGDTDCTECRYTTSHREWGTCSSPSSSACTCSEGDGGINSYSADTLTWGPQTHPDYCIGGGDVLREYYCTNSDSEFTYVDKNCVTLLGAVSCTAGECVPPANEPAAFCDDGVDNDQDGATDCDDNDCSADAFCAEGGPLCFNGIDDNGNGLADCADPSCQADHGICASSETTCEGIGDWDCCTDGYDNDGDGALDCADSQCNTNPECDAGIPITELYCQNGVDDDEDGLTDCDDDDCDGASSCLEPVSSCGDGIREGNEQCDGSDFGEVDDGPNACADFLNNEIYTGSLSCNPSTCTIVSTSCLVSGTLMCSNGVDDDGVGGADCDDNNCVGYTGPEGVVCQANEAAHCTGGFDEDGDGLVDCDDPECFSYLACLDSEICDNSIDDDGDGLVDCNDTDCASNSYCVTGPEICGNGIDDDGNGLTDSDDPYCGIGGGGPTECSDGIDNDGDGLVDLDDSGCSDADDDTEGECPESSGAYCLVVDTPNSIYELTYNLDASSFTSGVSMAADFATLDCNGNIIYGDGTGNGASIRDRTEITIRDCVFQNFDDGIDIERTQNSLFEDNMIMYMANDGVNGESSNEGNRFIGNTILHTGQTSDNGDGIYLHLGADNVIEGNTFEDIGRHAINLRYETRANTTGNIGTDIGTYGIKILGGDDHIITDNTIAESTDGLRLESVDNAQIERNTIENSQYGIRFTDAVLSASLISNRLCDVTSRSFFCTGSSGGAMGNGNFGLQNLDLCVDQTPNGAFVTCFEQNACSDELDNDGDGLIDCADISDCEARACGNDKVCHNGGCTAIEYDPAAATTGPIEVPFKFDTYLDLFTYLNTGTIVQGTGSCTETCTTVGQVCGFAQGGMNTCQDLDSTYCTCYTIN